MSEYGPHGLAGDGVHCAHCSRRKGSPTRYPCPDVQRMKREQQGGETREA